MSGIPVSEMLIIPGLSDMPKISELKRKIMQVPRLANRKQSIPRIN